MGKVKIIDPGFFTTIQDKGRFGFAKYGVPFSGAMDQTSFRLANGLLNNTENAACLEWVFQPPVLQFFEPTIICLTGALSDWFLNDQMVSVSRLIEVKKDDVLRGNFCKNKIYGYVGIKYGFQSPLVLESRSFFNSITPNSVFKKEDVIDYSGCTRFEEQFSHISAVFPEESVSGLYAYKGPEFDQLSADQKNQLTTSSYTISGSANRMAIQLEEVLPNSLSSMLTSPVLPGTVQLTPSGKLIVLMRDCQTTGGYPRVLQLSQDAINIIAQKRIKDTFKFQIIDQP